MKKLLRPVVFCGIKHCGKSTLGALLAQRCTVPFFDTDAVLEKKKGLPVREIFRQLGAEEFRRQEAEVVREFAAENRAGRVIATGGGVFSNPFLTEETLRALGFCVFLDIDFQLAFQRVVRNGLPPFLAEAADPEAEFNRMNQERCKVFKKYAGLVFPVERELPAAELVAELERRIAECGVLV